MRVIHNILFTFAMVVGLTISMSAQQPKGDKKPTPPKGDPPVVNPAPPKNPPSDKPKKPSMAFVVWKNETGTTA